MLREGKTTGEDACTINDLSGGSGGPCKPCRKILGSQHTVAARIRPEPRPYTARPAAISLTKAKYCEPSIPPQSGVWKVALRF
jgi:hypothetical protein